MRRPWPRPHVDGDRIVLAIACLWVGLLAVLPTARLAMAALWPEGAFDLTVVLSAASSRSAWFASLHSLETSLVGGLGALVIGSAVALALALTDVRCARLLAFLFVLSTMMAPQVTALAVLTLTGPSSPLLNALGIAPAAGTANPILGRDGIMLLLALHHAPLVFITVRAGLRTVPRDLVEAARAGGQRPPGILRHVILPMLRPYLLAGGGLAFVAAIGNFGIPALLGLGRGYLTLPTLIYQTLSTNGPTVLAEVASLAMLVAGLALLGLVPAMVFGGGRDVRITVLTPAERVFQLGRWRSPTEAVLWALVAAVLLLPVLSLLATALVPAYGVTLSPTTATIDNFVEVILRQRVTARAILNSSVYALSAAAILAVAAIPFAKALARHGGRLARVAEAAFEIPFALPGIVLAIAMILLFLKPLPLIGISLYATPAIIILAYVSRFAILAIRAPMVAVRQMPRDLEEAAQASGAGYARRLVTIVAPIVAPAAAAGALLVFLTAFNELTVSALLWGPGTETMGVVLYNLEEGGYAPLAAAVAILSIVVVLIAMLALDVMGRRLPRGVVPWR